MSGATMRHAIFPLNTFLLPGEITHLHIFEPRYKQLLHDVESKEIDFGIFFRHKENSLNLVTLVTLKKVMKRYPGGELDITVRASKLFKLEWFFEKLDDRLYPGGEISRLKDQDDNSGEKVFMAYRDLMRVKYGDQPMELPQNRYEIASNLNLSLMEKVKLVNYSNAEKKDEVILNHIHLYTAIARQETDSAFNYNLN